MTAFRLRSYVPGTAEWRLYRQVTRWMGQAGDAVRLALPDAPAPPQPPRDVAALLFAMNAMEASLAGVQLLADGNDGPHACAVIEEHWPIAAT